MNKENTALTLQGSGQSAEEEAALAKNDGLIDLKVMHWMSPNAMENDPPGIRAGDFLLVSGKIRIPCGKEGNGFRCVVGPSRPKAMHYDAAAKKVTFSTHDIKSPEWAKTIAKVNARGKKDGYKAGAEYLLYLPDFDAFGVFFVANGERETIIPRLSALRDAKKLARVTTTTNVEKKIVNLVVEPDNSAEPIKLPAKERQDRVLAEFDAYKLEKAAPPVTRQR